MKTGEKALAIIRIIDQDCAIAREDYIRSACSLAGLRAEIAEKARMENYEDFVGGFPTGSNPDDARILRATLENETIEAKWHRYEEILEFARDTFLSMIPDELVVKHLTPKEPEKK
jgi:hypothetical protein